jgi:hypothetical protein
MKLTEQQIVDLIINRLRTSDATTLILEDEQINFETRAETLPTVTIEEIAQRPIGPGPKQRLREFEVEVRQEAKSADALRVVITAVNAAIHQWVDNAVGIRNCWCNIPGRERKQMDRSYRVDSYVVCVE